MVESWTGPRGLVGREAALALLTGLLDAVGDRGCAHAITGEAGIGKTFLLAAAGRSPTTATPSDSSSTRSTSARPPLRGTGPGST
ncbi:AAA family ATPase [Streptomyces sp. CA-106110]|uniref:AAA family ATPase n=1 Tax=Streptomyces sp. CA-106110 TaxID=3240044 RepID=UPI003D8EE4FF